MNKLNVKELLKKEEGYLVGLFLGDGYFSIDKNRHYKTCFCLNPKRDGKIIRKTANLLLKIGLKPCLVHNNGCIEVRVNSILFVEHMKKQKKDWIKEKDEEFLLGLISGLIDSDGNVGNGEIVITNKNKSILKKVEEIIKEKGIHSKLWKKINKGKEAKWNFEIYKLRIGMAFKKLEHNSVKLHSKNSGGFRSD